MVALLQNLIKLNFMLSLELVIVIILCTANTLSFWSINIYISVGVPLLTFLCAENSSIG